MHRFGMAYIAFSLCFFLVKEIGKERPLVPLEMAFRFFEHFFHIAGRTVLGHKLEMRMDLAGPGKGKKIPIDGTVPCFRVLFFEEPEIIPAGQKGLEDPFGFESVDRDKMLSAEYTDPIVLFIGEGIGENDRLPPFNGAFGTNASTNRAAFWGRFSGQKGQPIFRD